MVQMIYLWFIIYSILFFNNVALYTLYISIYLNMYIYISMVFKIKLTIASLSEERDKYNETHLQYKF